ncbi:MAG TPA: DUF5372 family protein [Phycisphaerae bacterium]|nr:DUF5372 family protein [Phycisphaerae bacterium]
MSTPRNAPGGAEAAPTFRVTHPFHPSHGQRFSIVTIRDNWGDRRLYYHDQSERLISIPDRWTDLVPPDPVVALSAGRSPFRLEDLLELVRLLAVLDQEVRHEH